MATFELARFAKKLAILGKFDTWEASPLEVRNCINFLDVDLARKILSRNRKLIEVLGMKIPGLGSKPGVLSDFLLKGYKGSTDMGKNWKLTTNGKSWTSHSESESCQLGKTL
jgi:hypothetical protein